MSVRNYLQRVLGGPTEFLFASFNRKDTHDFCLSPIASDDRMTGRVPASGA